MANKNGKHSLFNKFVAGTVIVGSAVSGCNGEKPPRPKDTSTQLEDMMDKMGQAAELQQKMTDKAAEHREETDKRVDEMSETVSEIEQNQEELGKQIKEGFEKAQQEAEARHAQVQDNFSKVDERFNGVDERFNGVDKRLDGLTERADQADKGREKLKEMIESKQKIVSYDNGYTLRRGPVSETQEVISLFDNNDVLVATMTKSVQDKGREVELQSRTYKDRDGDTEIDDFFKGGFYKGASALQLTQQLESVIASLEKAKGDDFHKKVETLYEQMPELEEEPWNVFTLFREVGAKGTCLSKKKSEVSVEGSYKGKGDVVVKKITDNSYHIQAGDEYRWMVQLSADKNNAVITGIKLKQGKSGKAIIDTVDSAAQTFAMPANYIAWMAEAWNAAYARGQEEAQAADDEAQAKIEEKLREKRSEQLGEIYDRGVHVAGGGDGYGFDLQVRVSAGSDDENVIVEGLVDRDIVDMENGDMKTSDVAYGRVRLDFRLGETPKVDAGGGAYNPDERSNLGVDFFAQRTETEGPIEPGAETVETAGQFTTTQTPEGGSENSSEDYVSGTVDVVKGGKSLRVTVHGKNEHHHSEESEHVLVEDSTGTIPDITHDIDVVSDVKTNEAGGQVQYGPVLGEKAKIDVIGSYKQGKITTDTLTTDVSNPGNVTTQTPQNSETEFSEFGFGATLRMGGSRWKLSSGGIWTTADVEGEDQKGFDGFVYVPMAFGSSVVFVPGYTHKSGDGVSRDGGSITLAVDGADISKSVETLDNYLNNEAMSRLSNQFTPKALETQQYWNWQNLMLSLDPRFILSVDVQEMYDLNGEEAVGAAAKMGGVIGRTKNGGRLVLDVFYGNMDDLMQERFGVNFGAYTKRGFGVLRYEHTNGKSGNPDTDSIFLGVGAKLR